MSPESRLECRVSEPSPSIRKTFFSQRLSGCAGGYCLSRRAASRGNGPKPVAAGDDVLAVGGRFPQCRRSEA